MFHRGAKVSENAAAFTLEGGTRLLSWVTSDRAVASLGGPHDAAEQAEAIVDLIRRWLTACARASTTAH